MPRTPPTPEYVEGELRDACGDAVEQDCSDGGEDGFFSLATFAAIYHDVLKSHTIPRREHCQRLLTYCPFVKPLGGGLYEFLDWEAEKKRRREAGL